MSKIQIVVRIDENLIREIQREMSLRRTYPMNRTVAIENLLRRGVRRR